MSTVAQGVIVVAALIAPASADAQQARPEQPPQLAASSIRVEEGPNASTPTLRLSADIVDVSTGRVVDVVDVEGSRDRVHDLLLKLAASLAPAGGVSPDGTSLEASALFALADLFEERGYHDLAADTYEAIATYHPELADAAQGWEQLEGPWEINVFAGLLNDEPEFANDSETGGYRRDVVFGLRGSYRFSRNAFVQAEIENAAGKLVSENATQELIGFPMWVSLGYDVRVSSSFQLFPTVGAGAVVWNPGGDSSGTDFGLTYGVGTRIFMSRKHALRSDIRLHQVLNAFGPSWSQVDVTGARTLWALELTFGVSWFPTG